MCLDCLKGSFIGGFDHCRKTDKYPHSSCDDYEPDPLYVND
jgi:hypothetical protein